MLETIFEQQCCKKIKEIGGRAFKWVAPGVTGVPDRICIFPGGRIIFVEFKKPGRSNGLNPRQKKMVRVLVGLGCDVRVISNKVEFQKLMEDMGYGVSAL